MNDIICVCVCVLQLLNVQVPIVFKHLVDTLNAIPPDTIGTSVMVAAGSMIIGCM